MVTKAYYAKNKYRVTLTSKKGERIILRFRDKRDADTYIRRFKPKSFRVKHLGTAPIIKRKKRIERDMFGYPIRKGANPFGFDFK